MEHLSFREALNTGNSLKTNRFTKVPHNWAKHVEMLVFEPWPRTWVLGGHQAGDFFTTRSLGRQKITCLLGEENPLKIEMEPKNIILNLKRKVIYLNRTLFRFFWFHACENVRGCKVTPLLRFFNEHPWKRWMKHLKPSSISHLGQTNLMVSQWGGAKFITLLIDTPKSSN